MIWKRRNTCQEVETIEHICRYTKCHISSTCHAFNMHSICPCTQVTCQLYDTVCVCLPPTCHALNMITISPCTQVTCQLYDYVCVCLPSTWHALNMITICLWRKLHVCYMIMYVFLFKASMTATLWSGMSCIGLEVFFWCYCQCMFHRLYSRDR